VTFQVSANSFFQTNTQQAERLFSLVADACELDASETLLDLYSGTGAISLLLARRVRAVYGIEVAAAAVADAIRNARANGIDNCTFLAGEVRHVLPDLVRQGVSASIVVADPRARASIQRRCSRWRPWRPRGSCTSRATRPRSRATWPTRPPRLPARVGAAGGHVPADPAHRGRRPPAPAGMRAFLTRRLLQSLVVLLGSRSSSSSSSTSPATRRWCCCRRRRRRRTSGSSANGWASTTRSSCSYARFLRGALQGNFGESIRHGEPAFGLVVERMPATFQLAGAALLLALCLAIPAGIVSAFRRNTLIDYVSTVIALPRPVHADLLARYHADPSLLRAAQLLPSSGRGEWRHLVLPAVTLASSRRRASPGSRGRGCWRCWARTTSAPRAPRA